MRISVLLTFTLPPINLPMVLVFVFLYRDAVVSTLRTICALRGFALAARKSGKIKAIIQAIASFIILMLMIPYSQEMISLEYLQKVSFWVVLVAAIYTLFSGIEYLYINKGYIANLFTKKAVT